MKDLWERFKRWWNAPSTDPFDVWEATREAREKELRAARINQARAELRDRFAMAALTGLLAHRDSAPSFISRHQDQRARMAYEYADAMLKARGDE